MIVTSSVGPHTSGLLSVPKRLDEVAAIEGAPIFPSPLPRSDDVHSKPLPVLVGLGYMYTD